MSPNPRGRTRRANPSGLQPLGTKDLGPPIVMGGREGDPEFVVVGHLTKPHGTKGEILVRSLTDRPDSTFRPTAHLLISDSEGRVPDPAFSPVRVATVRAYRKGFLVLFEGVQGRDGAERLRNRYLLRRFDEIEPLEEGEISYHQLLGLNVITADGREVGRITEVYGVRPAELLEVEGRDGNHLVPFTREMIVDWSLEEGKMVIDPPEGLLEL